MSRSIVTLIFLLGIFMAHDTVAAPLSTVDMSIPDGSHIPIEERGAEEVLTCFGMPVAPPNVRVRNPAFDVTPARLVEAIITEVGVLRAPYEQSLADAFARQAAEKRRG